MASITLQKFGGIVPRTSPRLLPNGAATAASMAKLWSGELRPFRDLSLVNLPVEGELPTNAPVLTIYQLADKWLAWTKDVSVVSGFTALAAAGQIYYTGDGAPKQTSYDAVNGGPATPVVSYPIGIVGPTTAPTVVVVGVGTGSPVFRSYVYTFYSDFNEESVPSAPTAPIAVENSQSTVLDNWEAPPPHTQEIRIYRTVGGEYLYVDKIYITTPGVAPGAYNDTKLDYELSETLQSQHYYPPPADIEGLIGLACGSLAAFHGNKVVFSEPYQPGAWPPEYEKVFDYNVVAIGTFGQTTVVATIGHTYLVQGSHPSSFSVARVPDPYPCISKRSMVSADNGVVYASKDGLIFIGNPSYSGGQVSTTHVLTRALLTFDEWQAYNPPTIVGAIFDGRYYGFYQNLSPVAGNTLGAGFMFDFSARGDALITGVIEDAGAEDRTDTLINLDFYASAMYTNPLTALYLVKQEAVPPARTPPIYNRLFQWEGGANYRPFVWRSKQFSFPYAVTFSAAKFMFNPAFPLDAEFTFRVYDGNTRAMLYERTVATANPIRLPSLAARTDWMFEVEGRSAVQLVQLASSFQDLVERK